MFALVQHMLRGNTATSDDVETALLETNWVDLLHHNSCSIVSSASGRNRDESWTIDTLANMSDALCIHDATARSTRPPFTMHFGIHTATVLRFFGVLQWKSVPALKFPQGMPTVSEVRNRSALHSERMERMHSEGVKRKDCCSKQYNGTAGPQVDVVARLRWEV